MDTENCWLVGRLEYIENFGMRVYLKQKKEQRQMHDEVLNLPEEGGITLAIVFDNSLNLSG